MVDGPVRSYSLAVKSDGKCHTYQEGGLRLSTGRETFQVMVESCSCHEEVLVNVAEHRVERVERRVEEHGMRLDLEGTAWSISLTTLGES